MKCSVTDLGARRRGRNVLSSLTIVLGGINYGSVPLSVPYEAGKPLVLYVVPADAAPGTDGPLECLITDDAALGADLDLAR
jgi:hypothetical protein